MITWCIARNDSGCFANVRGGPSVRCRRPSVAVRLLAAAEAAGKNAVGVLLT